MTGQVKEVGNVVGTDSPVDGVGSEQEQVASSVIQPDDIAAPCTLVSEPESPAKILFLPKSIWHGQLESMWKVVTALCRQRAQTPAE